MVNMFRVGTSNNRNVYFDPDPSNNPDDKTGRLVCTAQTGEAPQMIAYALNRLWETEFANDVARRLVGYSMSVDVSNKPEFSIGPKSDGAVP